MCGGGGGGGASSAEGSRGGTPVMPLSPEVMRRGSGNIDNRSSSMSGSRYGGGIQEPRLWLKLCRIGRGAYGDVFQCLNKEDGSCFAAKQVPTGLNKTAASKEAKVRSAKQIPLQKQNF